MAGNQQKFKYLVKKYHPDKIRVAKSLKTS